MNSIKLTFLKRVIRSILKESHVITDPITYGNLNNDTVFEFTLEPESAQQFIDDVQSNELILHKEAYIDYMLYAYLPTIAESGSGGIRYVSFIKTPDELPNPEAYAQQFVNIIESLKTLFEQTGIEGIDEDDSDLDYAIEGLAYTIFGNTKSVINKINSGDTTDLHPMTVSFVEAFSKFF